MKMQTPWAIALLLTAASAPAEAGMGVEAAGDRACVFASHQDYHAFESSLGLASGGPHSSTSMCDVIAFPAVDAPDASEDPCPQQVVTRAGTWVFTINGLVRDPPLGGASYLATAVQEETWVRSNSYCVLASFTCTIAVGDGSRFRREGHTLPAWGYSEVVVGQYKMFGLLDPTVNCHQPRGGGTLLPGIYVDGTME